MSVGRNNMKDRVYLRVAAEVAKLATCPDRHVGAVVLDARGLVRGIGYNGMPRGLSHCVDGCPDGRCQAVHAEANAMLVAGHDCVGGALYCTTLPCAKCLGLVINAGISVVVFSEDNKEVNRCIDLCEAAGIYLYHFSNYDDLSASAEAVTG